MLVVEVDRLDAEPLEAALARRAHVLGLAVDAADGAILAADDAELGGEHYLVTPAADRAPHQLLVRVRPVHVGRVEEVDAQVERAVDGRDGLRLVTRSVELRHAHAAEPDRGDGRAVAAETALLHQRSY
jgi:hypothetical protein